MKKNKASEYESIEITITKERFPLVFEGKVSELVEEEGMSREEAERFVEGMKVEMELMYEQGQGLFLAEADVVADADIYSPYTGKKLDDADDDEGIGSVQSLLANGYWENERQ